MQEETKSSFGIPEEQDLEEINTYALKSLTAQEVFVFTLTLCDNDTDRDFDRFSVDALEKLAPMFLGKSGIFDHAMRAKDQTARVYRTWVQSDPARTTRQGEPYAALKAKAYCLRTPSNAEFIAELEGGIRKEVSVSCSVASAVCTVCGKNTREELCSHIPGRFYRKSGKKELCCHILSDPFDAYEWSFVAVPAQKAAGVTKAFDGGETGGEAPMTEKNIGEQTARLTEYRQALCEEIRGYAAVCPPTVKSVLREELLASLELSELLKLRKELCRTAAEAPAVPQLMRTQKQVSPQASGDQYFKI